MIKKANVSIKTIIIVTLGILVITILITLLKKTASIKTENNCIENQGVCLISDCGNSLELPFECPNSNTDNLICCTKVKKGKNTHQIYEGEL